MNKVTKIAIAGIFICSLIIQIFSAVRNTNYWPISSFNVFNQSTKGTVWVFRAILTDSMGQKETVDTARLLPLEFFKARSIIAKVYASDYSKQEKDQFGVRMLERLNSSKWFEFDEIYPPPKSQNLVSFKLEAWRLNTNIRDSKGHFTVSEIVPIYSSPGPDTEYE